jgi:hypothetical protein
MENSSRKINLYYIILICILFASSVIPSYSFYISNHNEQIPIILRTIDKEYLKNDWFVNQNDGFSPRFYYSLLMAELSELLGLSMAFFLVYVVSLISLLIIISLISFELFNSYLAPIATLYLIIYGPININNVLGGDWLIYDILIPASIALPLTTLSIFLFLKKRHYLAFSTLGIATFVQPLEGLLITGILFLYLFIMDKSINSRKKLFSLISYAIPGFIALLPVITLSSDIQSQQIFEIITFIRHPHHYCPFSFPTENYIRFLGLFIIFLALMLWKLKADWSKKDKFFYSFFSLGVGLLFIGTIFVEIVPIPLIGKLQLFRLAPYLVLVMYLYIGYGVSQIFNIFTENATIFNGYKLHNYITHKFTHKYNNKILFIGLIFVTLIFVNTVIHTSYIPKDGPRDIMYVWIKENTPKDAIFLIDPKIEDFRLRADRAIVVDWKAFPFRDVAVMGWWERIQDIANRNQVHGTPDELDSINLSRKYGASYSYVLQGYGTLDELNTINLSRKYGASYILVEKPKYMNFTLVYEDKNYRIYSINM